MEPEREGHPVVMGLVALVGVGLVVGLLLSGGALAASQILGLTGNNTDTGASSQQSLYAPRPSPTERQSGPLVTLAPGQSSPSQKATESQSPQFKISLSAGETQVQPMQQIDLTGTYPGGEGHIVRVQRFESGSWADFASVDAVVTNSTFSTYVLTSRSGLNRFRVKDTDSGAVSNEVRVRVG